MSRITEELLRRRSEHNDGRLTNLEEVTLHQQNIIKIESLDVLCRHLRIIYLQNNLIEKIEGLSKLKELEYLNLALNNITVLEGLEQCESLNKLDLTINFIEIDYYPESLFKLKPLVHLKELFLTGNPVTDWSGYKALTIAILQQLDMLDGREISKSERIQALQDLPALLSDYESYTEVVRIKRKAKEALRVDIDYSDPNRLSEHHPEERKRTYWQQHEDREAEEKRKNPDKFKEKPQATAMHRLDEEGQQVLRQCNEGKYPFQLSEFDDHLYSYFAIEVPKYLETTQVDINLFPLFVSVRVKDKLTQVRLSDEIVVSKSDVQRSQVTGKFTIKMLKVKENYVVQNTNRLQQQQRQIKQQQDKQNKKDEDEQRRKKLEQIDQIESKQRIKDTTTFTQKQFQQDDSDDMPDLE